VSEPCVARAFWVVAPGASEIRREELPALPEAWVRVRTRFSGVSRGTESLVFRGQVPVSEYQRMRAPFQDGEFPAPVKYGYINIGAVVAGPPVLRGQLVYCLYPHQDIYQVPASAVVPLPATLPPGRAVLAANLETAVNGLWDASPRLGDRIAVIGGGTLGCLVAWLAGRIPGCDVELIDTEPSRREIADTLGVRFAAPESATPDADLVIHASGSPAGLATALELAGFEATVLELSWFGTKSVTLSLGEAFHQRRLRLISSQVGSVATAQRARWDHGRRFRFVLSLLAEPGSAPLDALITDEDRFEALPEVLARLAPAERQGSGAAGTLTQRIRYD
jgi:threonine dehydrogenase-like Zn-dependent dehydrogenase